MRGGPGRGNTLESRLGGLLLGCLALVGQQLRPYFRVGPDRLLIGVVEAVCQTCPQEMTHGRLDGLALEMRLVLAEGGEVLRYPLLFLLVDELLDL